MPKLTARKVETAPPGKYGDGGGLQFVVSPAKTRKWVFRYLWQGRAREMGLGPYPEIGLAEAREKALEARRLVRSGLTPSLSGRQIVAFRRLAHSPMRFSEI